MLNYRYLVIASIAMTALVAHSQETITTPDSVANDLYDELDEFVISVKKKLVSTDGAKLTYNLDEDKSTSGQSLLDALRKVPMVTVDGEDNIKIKGSSQFKIYVNGKEDAMLSANYKQVLKSMPSDAVSKIEVITEPGAKYDAEGVGGILNLITERKQTKEGYTGNINAGFSSQQSQISVYGRVKQNKVTADAGFTYANNLLQKQSNTQHIETYDLNNINAYKKIDELDQSVSYNFYMGNINLSWEPTSNDLISLGGDINYVDANLDKLTQNTSTFSRSDVLQWSTLQDITGTIHNLGANLNFGYRRALNDKGQSITAAYRFNYGINPMEMEYQNSTLQGNYESLPYSKSSNKSYQREHTATIDYLLPLADGKHTIEAGAKGVFRHNTAITSYASGNNASELAIFDIGNTRQIQNVYALYGVYTGRLGNWNLTAGIRYEHTYMGLDFIDSEMADFRSRLNDVVPNAAVAYSFGPTSNLRLSYQMRISRPTISQLNPETFYISQSFANQGNPNLNSERFNGLSLSYSNFTSILGGNIELSYNQSNNTIEDFTYWKDGVSYSTYGNFGNSRKTRLSGFLNWNITSQMSFSVNGAINYTDISSKDKSIHNYGWNGEYGANWNYTGRCGIKYSAYGGQSTGDIRLQSRSFGWYYYGLGISKSFLKNDALTLSINATNFLTKYTSWRSEIITPDNIQKIRGKNRSWNVGMTISWNFGQLKEQVKKTNANINNNDSKATSGGTSIGI